jgi:DNA primase
VAQISDEIISEVRDRAKIQEIVAEYVSLKRAGANATGLCPFHGEKSPSFNVNPGRGIFHCFGCGVGGDVFTFLMKIEGLDFPEAVRFLAKRVGVVIEERAVSPGEKRRVDERERFFRINELAVAFYRRFLLEDREAAPAREYLKRRGVDDSIGEAYRLGFAPDRWDLLTRHLERQGVAPEQAEKLGLLRRRDGGGYYDTFRNRLLFVIADPQGHPIGFGGRVLDDSLPKYINSPESPVYRKSEVLFGIHLAKPAMRESGRVLIVEGYFDHLALYQAGVKNVVAACGTALTEQHLKLLSRYAGRIDTLFDADGAGRKATLRTVDLCLTEQVPASVVELPQGEDPDSFIRKEGKEAFVALVARARPAFDFLTRETLRRENVGSADGKARVANELAPRLLHIRDPIERERYLQEVARSLDIDPQLLRQSMGREPVRAERIATRERGPATGGDPEEMLLAIMGKFPPLARSVAAEGIDAFFRPELAGIAGEIMRQMLEEDRVDWPAVLRLITPDEERSRLAALFIDETHLNDMDVDKAVAQCRASREKALLGEAKTLRQELFRVEPESERYWEILRRLDELRARKSLVSSSVRNQTEVH